MPVSLAPAPAALTYQILDTGRLTVVLSLVDGPPIELTGGALDDFLATVAELQEDLEAVAYARDLREGNVD